MMCQSDWTSLAGDTVIRVGVAGFLQYNPANRGRSLLWNVALADGVVVDCLRYYRVCFQSEDWLVIRVVCVSVCADVVSRYLLLQ
jgi:hypothetical protein